MKTIFFLLLGVTTFGVSAQNFIKMDLGDLTSTSSASRSANFLDVNDDGWDDIFISNGKSGGQNNMLYINNGDGSFTTVTTDDIVNDGGSSDAASFADVDNDGDLDMMVVTWHGQINSFYRNLGDGSFDYEPDAAMGNTLTYSEAAAWGDANGDGCVDLCITNSGLTAEGRINFYYENKCDGLFEKINNQHPSDNLARRSSRSVDWIDLDDDGDLDLFITNEYAAKNYLYINDGTGQFTENTTSQIVSVARSSAGSSWSDVDNDGDFDLFIANYRASSGDNQNNELYLNEGNLVFTPVTTGDIVNDGGCSFTSTFGDYDNDGDEDLFIGNAYCPPNHNFVYENTGGVFERKTSSILEEETGYTFGAAWGDYNQDGFIDLICANTFSENETNDFYENQPNGNSWYKIRLVGATLNKSAIGSIVKVKATIDGNPRWQMRRINSNSGYCSQNSYTQHFGLKDATMIDSLVINWFSGDTEVFTNLDVNKTCAVMEQNGITCQGVSGMDLTNNTIEFTVRRINETNEFAIESKTNTIHFDSILIYDMFGKLVNSINNINDTSTTIDLNQNSTGYYVLKVHFDNNYYKSIKLYRQP